MQTPEQIANFANQITKEIANDETRQRLEIANGGTDWRWQVAHANEANPSVSILRRGANRSTIITISQENTPDLYPYWKPVIEEWRKEHTSCKRCKHDKLQTPTDIYPDRNV